MYFQVNILVGLILLVSNFNVSAQNERVYHEVEPELIMNLGDQGIFQPALLAVDNNGLVAIYDYGVHNLFLINTSDNSVKKIGEGSGGGPKEFSNPTDLSYDKYNEHFWLTDPQQARISVWNSSGDLVRSISFNNASSVPVKAVPVSESTYVWQPKNYKEGVSELAISDHQASVKERLGRISIKPMHARFLKEGSITADSTGIYYAGYKSGFIKKFSANSGVVSTINSIEDIPKPEVINRELDIEGMKDVRVTKLNDDSVIATLDVDVYEEKLYVLFSGSTSGISKTIDVYDTQNGEYLYSYRVQDLIIRKFNIINGRVIALSKYDDRDQLIEFPLVSSN
ncbi:6-bladed beta-propeller [Gracilimonas sp. Q87]|uniref:6-bladed beta-propeller n=1 Tax=Gracilimonas sp. Q87 TaxID=3384766 RepID=UPI00398460A3